MRVKRFVANSMQEAIKQVKADFGHEAVILHTKRIKRGGLLGLFGKSKVEVIAATDAKRGARPTVGRGVPVGAAATRSSRNGASGREESAAATELARVREELDSIKRTLQVTYGGEPAEASAAVAAARARLLEQEMAEDHVRDLVAGLLARSNQEQRENADWIARELRGELIVGIECADPWKVGDEARVQCLVGPTGVGKTTTIAKLAANYSLLAGKRVALITVDTYRIAAVEQLKTYAEIIGVPVDVAFTPAELKEAMERRAAYDLILVDTAGRSQKNKMQMQELRAFLEVFPDPQVHLVLSATTRLSDMMEIAQRFGSLPVSYLLVTKLDETSTYGTLYSLCRATGTPLSYLTTGQSVPDDIEVAEAERIADMILGVKG